MYLPVSVVMDRTSVTVRISLFFPQKMPKKKSIPSVLQVHASESVIEGIRPADPESIMECAPARELNPFVRDYTLTRFVGTSFYLGPRRAIYEQELLDRNLFPAIHRVFRHHGFSPVDDPMKVLQLVIGNGIPDSMQWKGPAYLMPAGAKPTNYDFRGLFMIRDREMLINLTEVIFSMKDFVARNSAAVPLNCRLLEIGFDTNTGFRKAVIIFTTGVPDDWLRVTIQGANDEPNTFTFERTKTWITNRYLEADKISWSSARD